MSFQDEIYECCKCKHIYKHTETVWVVKKKKPGLTGTCPKCGHHVFTIVKPKTKPTF